MRHGCRSLVNFEILPQPPADRAADNPWPTWPKIFRIDYGHEEAAKRFGADPRVYSISGKSFDGKDGRLTGMRTTEVKFVGPKLEEIPNTEKVWKADLILIAMGFLGPEHEASDALGVAYDPRSNLRADYGRVRDQRTEGIRGRRLPSWPVAGGSGDQRRSRSGERDRSHIDGRNAAAVTTLTGAAQSSVACTDANVLTHGFTFPTLAGNDAAADFASACVA